MGQKFRRNRSISHGFQDTIIQNGRHFWQDRIFLKIGLTTLRDILWVRNFFKISLSLMVFEIQAFLHFAIFAKNLKIQNGRHFWQDKYFFENWINYSAEIPYG